MYAPRLVTYSASVCVLMLRVNICLAQADTPVELTWEAPENCSQKLSDVQQQLRALVGATSDELLSPLRAHGTIEPLDKRYRLTLVIERSATRGVRVIESDDCHSLGKAAAVVLGLLVQKERTLGRELSETEISGQPQPPSEPEHQPTPVPPKEAPPTAPATPRPRARSRRFARWRRPACSCIRATPHPQAASIFHSSRKNVRSMSAVPTGLRMHCWFRQPHAEARG